MAKLAQSSDRLCAIQTLASMIYRRVGGRDPRLDRLPEDRFPTVFPQTGIELDIT